MTADQKFARVIKFSMITLALIFAYFLLADLKMPLTPQAMATRTITQIAPQISGPITALHAQNNQMIKQGELLFEIDPAPYLLAVEATQLQLEQTHQHNEQLDASLLAAEADARASAAIAQQKQAEARRLEKLLQSRAVSHQRRDDAVAEAAAAQANLMAAKARLQELQVRRGSLGEHNISLRVAQNQLQQALLNLSYTRVRAERDSVVTNLQLEVGAYATAGQSLLALVADEMDIIADFREKSLRHVAPGKRALVAFDGEPGRLYEARITGIDAGVSAGQFAADGWLAAPVESNRWIRDAQRMRVHLTLDDGTQSKRLPSGARATVQLLSDNLVFAGLAHLQLRLLSLLHYIY